MFSVVRFRLSVQCVLSPATDSTARLLPAHRFTSPEHSCSLFKAPQLHSSVLLLLDACWSSPTARQNPATLCSSLLTLCRCCLHTVSLQFACAKLPKHIQFTPYYLLVCIEWTDAYFKLKMHTMHF